MNDMWGGITYWRQELLVQTSVPGIAVVGCSARLTNQFASRGAALQLKLKDDFVLHHAHAEWLGCPADCRDESSSSLFWFGDGVVGVFETFNQ